MQTRLAPLDLYGDASGRCVCIGSRCIDISALIVYFKEWLRTRKICLKGWEVWKIMEAFFARYPVGWNPGLVGVALLVLG